MHYDFVPMPDRKPLKWPGGKRLALTITFNLEYWDLTQDHDGLYIPGGPSLNDRLMPARIPDYSNYSWREYGHRAGIWRLFDICDRAGIPASCTVNAKLCMAYSPQPTQPVEKPRISPVETVKCYSASSGALSSTPSTLIPDS